MPAPLLLCLLLRRVEQGTEHGQQDSVRLRAGAEEAAEVPGQCSRIHDVDRG